MALIPEIVETAILKLGKASKPANILQAAQELFPNESFGKYPLENVRACLHYWSRDAEEGGRKRFFVSLGHGLYDVIHHAEIVADELDAGFRTEGFLRLLPHFARERDHKLIKEFKAHLLSKGEMKCGICNFDFSFHYGPLGKNYIEAHHINPLANGEQIATWKNLYPLCANCHRMTHRAIKEGIDDSVAHIRQIYRR